MATVLASKGSDKCYFDCQVGTYHFLGTVPVPIGRYGKERITRAYIRVLQVIFTSGAGSPDETGHMTTFEVTDSFHTYRYR